MSPRTVEKPTGLALNPIVIPKKTTFGAQRKFLFYFKSKHTKEITGLVV